MGVHLYYCMLWFNFTDEPMTKFIWASCPQELTSDFLATGYVAISVTEITNREVDSFEL
jgi:hypothetical protein